MTNAQLRTRRSGGLIAVALVLVLGIALSIWLFTRNRNEALADRDYPAGNLDSLALTPAAPATQGAEPRPESGVGAGVNVSEAALFAGQDIHDVPLGTILDYAQKLTYSEPRGVEKKLAPSATGQAPTVTIWPEAGASSLDEETLGRGRIVARIQSSGAYDDLGLAGGLNYLWVESRPGGGYRGVIIPATAFSPLHDIAQVRVTEKTPSGVPLEKGAFWITRDGKDVPWIACGRC